MTAKVGDISASRDKCRKRNWSDWLDDVQSDTSAAILSLPYRIPGSGYKTFADSFDERSSKLFREILLEAQTLQRGDESQLFHFVTMGNIQHVQTALINNESNICKEVEKDNSMKNASVSEKKQELKMRIQASLIDVSGANIAHVAYIYKHYEIGHYLVKKYPRLASQPYGGDIKNLLAYVEKGVNDDCQMRRKLATLRKRLGVDADAKMAQYMLYTGENILHMTVMRRNYEEVRWILDFYYDHRHSYPDCLSDMLRADVTGRFFDRKGSFYVGGNPLQFAVCSNSTAIFDLVYSFVLAVEKKEREQAGDKRNERNGGSNCAAASLTDDVIFSTDRFGNNVLHLCVLHSLHNMYKHVHEAAVRVMRRKLQALYIEDRTKGKEKYSSSTKIDPSTGGQDAPGFCVPKHGYRRRESGLLIPSSEDTVEKWTSVEAKRKVRARLTHALNNDLHSPLTLAASIIDKKKDTPAQLALKVDMLRFLTGENRHKLWEYGPVTMSILNLEGIDIKYDVLKRYHCEGRESEVVKKSVQSAICWLCIHDSDMAISIPEVAELIQAKWERMGYPFFYLSFLINLAFTVCLTLILIFISATPRAPTSYSTEIATSVLYLIVIVACLVMTVQEVHDVIQFKLDWYAIRGIALYDQILRMMKILSLFSYCCFKIISFERNEVVEELSHSDATVLFNVSDDQGIKLSIVVCVIASYLHLFYYCMGFDSTGPFVLTMFRIISRDVPYFMQFYAIVVVATACALSVLGSGLNPGAGYGFANLAKVIWTLIQDTVSVDATFDHINNINSYPAHLQWMADVILTSYYVVVVIMMLNLLIAMMSNTYNAYSEYNSAILLMAKYNIMHAMEWVMWPHELKENRSKYAQIKEPGITTVQVKMGLLESGSESVSHEKVESGRVQHTTAIPAADDDGITRYLFEQQTIDDAWYGNGEQPRGWIDRSAGQGGDATSTATPASASAVVVAPIEPSPQIGLTSSGSAVTRKTALFIIDPQADFHPGALCPSPRPLRIASALLP